ncbi:hypothetical protein GQ44DRAFT_700440 [Phaeosphaeriaceae sp. PMI808]|nr:hypothetical protein GQ44DRAFT_700440 [Phaeosphaeriaceae sp. PMI808]
MLSYASFSPDPSPCNIGTSPTRSRIRADHQRHGSEQIPRSRPLSMTSAPPAMQALTKRSSIYVSDASILLSHKNPILSPTAPHDVLSPMADITPGFIDHYASLELESNASIDHVRTAFRRLRGQYFQTDAVKYRAAQAAFDVLANPAARQDYDSIYRLRSVPSPEHVKHGRKDSAHGDHEGMPPLEEEEEAAQDMDARTEDPNWALKRYIRLYEPELGTEPYSSYVPILSAYEGVQRHPKLKSRRPVYTGEFAVYARPN